ncbi:MAG: TetR/AcrR family transcriptional regulator [Porticoccaceae bacterium]
MSVSDTRERLLEIVLELIWQSNYSCVGVNEICKQAGVTKGAFYHHFESKASLFCEATAYYWQVIKNDLDAVFSPLNSPLVQLENLLHFLIMAKLGNDQAGIRGCPFYTAGAQIGSTEEKVIEALQLLSQNAVKYNTALVRGLQSGGYLEEGVNVEQTALLLYHFIHGVFSYVQVHEGVENIKRDLTVGLYRLLTLKREHWYAEKPNWVPQQGGSHFVEQILLPR